jgi:uncharacterized protein YlbG (UPF0298 family)
VSKDKKSIKKEAALRKAEQRTKRKVDEGRREKLRQSRLNRKASDETKEKMSVAHTGKVLSAETKEKLRLTWLEKELTEDHRRKIGDGNRGKVVSAESRVKISEGGKGRVQSEETKEKIRNSLKGRTRPSEIYEKKRKTEVAKSPNLDKDGNVILRHVSEETRRKIGTANRNGRRVVVNGVHYRDIREAVEAVGINKSSILYRLNSANFPDSYYPYAESRREKYYGVTDIGTVILGSHHELPELMAETYEFTEELLTLPPFRESTFELVNEGNLEAILYIRYIDEVTMEFSILDTVEDITTHTCYMVNIDGLHIIPADSVTLMPVEDTYVRGEDNVEKVMHYLGIILSLYSVMYCNNSEVVTFPRKLKAKTYPRSVVTSMVSYIQITRTTYKSNSTTAVPSERKSPRTHRRRGHFRRHPATGKPDVYVSPSVVSAGGEHLLQNYIL